MQREGDEPGRRGTDYAGPADARAYEQAVKRVRYIGPFGNDTGYARAGHDYLKALLGQCELDIQPTHPWSKLDPVYECLRPYVETNADLNWPTHVIVHTIPFGAASYVTGNLAPNAEVKKICMTTWETVGFPDRLAADLAKFDKVIVPSVFCQDVMRNIIPSVVPHCFDANIWKPEPLNLSVDKYTFLWVGAWSERKNPIGLLKAYLTAFGAEDKVQLIIKTDGGPGPSTDITALKKALNLDKYPAIKLFQARRSIAEMVDLHNAADCYVTAHRGEGFCLGAFESAVIGNELIATELGGNADFMSYNDCAIPYQLTPVTLPEFANNKTVDPTGLDGKQLWAEPDLEELQEMLRSQFKAGKPDPARRTFLRNARKVELFEASQVAKRLLTTLS